MTTNATTATETKAPKKAPVARVKTNSLKEKGYAIASIDNAEADEKGGVFVNVVTSPRGTSYFIKKTKEGDLRAYRTKDAKDTTTIAGLFAFTEKDGDLIGEPFKSKRPRGEKVAA